MLDKLNQIYPVRYTAFIASMTLIISMPFRLTSEFGFTAPEMGLLMAPWPLTNIIVAPLSGWLSSRIPAGALGGITAGANDWLRRLGGGIQIELRPYTETRSGGRRARSRSRCAGPAAGRVAESGTRTAR